MAEVFTQIAQAIGIGQDYFAVAAIGASVTASQRLRHPAVLTAQFSGIAIAIAVNIAPWQRTVFGPRRATARIVVSQLLHRMLGQFAVSGEFATKHGKQWGFALLVMHIQRIVASYGLR
ncbi:hypothetical protein D3C77_597010 [compost metagenome]